MTMKKDARTSALPAAVVEAVNGIFTMTRLDERFRPDAHVLVAAAYAAGQEESKTVHTAAEPLQHHEVSAIREALASFPIIAESLTTLVGHVAKATGN